MAALRPVHRVLLYAVAFAACLLAATPSGVSAEAAPPVRTVALETLLYEDGRGGSEALLQYVHWQRFCRWYSRHGLCAKLVQLHRFCDRRPHHRRCADDDEDKFCRKHPYHRKCDDTPPSPS